MKLIVQPEAGVVPIVQIIRSARVSIDVCIFRFDRKAIERALAASVHRGVRVRALIAHAKGDRAEGLRKLEERLLASGVMVARTLDDLLRYHSKFMVVDDTLHLLGFNFTKNDIKRCRSFGIATKDRKSVQEALRLFEADCTRQTYTPSAKSNLVISPDGARIVLERFIREARRDLAIYDARIQDPVIISLLEERARKGVQVRVLGGMRAASGEIEVHPLKGLRLHVRAIVRDGTRAFVGSQSLRKQDLDKRREVGLIIGNPGITRALKQVFETDWSVSARGKEKEKEKESAKEVEAKEEGPPGARA
ncbi:MAG TPA: phospholipase D-like domain-containing protein [Candidatus Polarisedimenticolia bacterium]|nr:phospholipase D-like domain-containing protein [Candidatus Polarisedimenticolia bacterium]